MKRAGTTIRDQCIDVEIPFFFKQRGAIIRKADDYCMERSGVKFQIQLRFPNCTNYYGISRSSQGCVTSQNAQVLVSTQSVTLVNQFSLENLIIVDRVDDQSVFKRPDKKEMDKWLDEYGLGDLWEKNLLGGRP